MSIVGYTLFRFTKDEANRSAKSEKNRMFIWMYTFDAAFAVDGQSTLVC